MGFGLFAALTVLSAVDKLATSGVILNASVRGRMSGVPRVPVILPTGICPTPSCRTSPWPRQGSTSLDFSDGNRRQTLDHDYVRARVGKRLHGRIRNHLDDGVHLLSLTHYRVEDLYRVVCTCIELAREARLALVSCALAADDANVVADIHDHG